MPQAKGGQIQSPHSQQCWCLYSPYTQISIKSLVPGKAECSCATSSCHVFLHPLS